MVFGALSGVLSFFNSEFVLLTWIDSWGDAVAWFIRAGVIAIGGLLYSAEQRRIQEAHQSRQPQQQGPIS